MRDGNEKPGVVKIHDVQIDSNYVQWLGEIKSRYRSAQIKAAVKVNAEQLLFNWQLGRDLVTRKAEEQWGSGVVEQLSLDLQAAFPESKGFSTTNLWYMKKWYEFYSTPEALEKLHQLGGEIQSSDNQPITKLHQLGGEIVEPQITSSDGAKYPAIFSFVPWRHHVEIIAKCKTIEEALFYVKKCATEGWSRNTLENCLHAHYTEQAVSGCGDVASTIRFSGKRGMKIDLYRVILALLENGFFTDQNGAKPTPERSLRNIRQNARLRLLRFPKGPQPVQTLQQ